MKNTDNKQLKEYFEIKRAEQIIEHNSQLLSFDYNDLDIFISENFTELEKYILEEFYAKQISLKLIAINRGISYSYVRQVIHFSRKKLHTYIALQTKNSLK